MCKDNLKHICSISVIFAITTNTLLNCGASFPLASTQILLSCFLSQPWYYFIFVYLLIFNLKPFQERSLVDYVGNEQIKVVGRIFLLHTS